MENYSTKIIRVNSILDMPSSIEDMFNLEGGNILAVARSDNSIELWDTNSWIQIIKIPGLKSKIFSRKKFNKKYK